MLVLIYFLINSSLILFIYILFATIFRGAARVRSLFTKAGKETPSIIFIDELDTLGKQRSIRFGGTNEELEQTLNQLLACMDGLDTNTNNIIVIGATNRYEILDDALTRPGRFDRVIKVELPDRSGREGVLGVHARKLPISPSSNPPLLFKYKYISLFKFLKELISPYM